MEESLPSNELNNQISARSLNAFYHTVMEQAVENYTKSYETWKRVQNILKSFSEGLKQIPREEIHVLDLGCGDGFHLMLIHQLIKAT